MGGNSKLQLVKTGTVAREAIVDEFGELKRKEAAFEPTKQRLAILRSLIAGWIPDSHPGDQPISFPGIYFVANCTPAQTERRISSFGKLMKALGRVRFFALLSKLKGWVTALESEFGEGDAAGWFIEDRTGPRKISAVAKASPAAPEAA